MSFLKRIFGGHTFEEERDAAEQLFAAGEFGPAKLGFERARDKAKDESARAAMQARVENALDELATRALEEAERLFAQGDKDLAQEELRNAEEVARGEAVKRRVAALVEQLEKGDAVQAATALEISSEEQWVALSGTWEPEQFDEYEGYGDPFRDALIALLDGEVKVARQTLEALLEGAADPHFLHFEVARARLSDQDDEAAETAFRTFLASIGPDEGGESRLSAHAHLADIAQTRGDFDAAVAELTQAMQAFPTDPRTYLALAHFLRKNDHASDGVEILKAGRAALEDDPGVMYHQELGLCQRAAGDSPAAKRTLDGVLQTFVERRRMSGGELNYPPEAAVTLARIHEEEGELVRAADIFRTLLEGQDRQNHFAYHLETARILRLLGEEVEVERLLKRAQGLAHGNDEALAAIERVRRGEPAEQDAAAPAQ